jgi:Family of unknown function (DUF6636)
MSQRGVGRGDSNATSVRIRGESRRPSEETTLPPRVLGYGTTWSGGGLRCTSAVNGLICRNKSGHGFFLSRERWRAF